MDTITPEQRSRVMAAIHSRDTLPEVVVRKMLHSRGYRFRICDRKLPGKPDIVLPKYRTIIEIRGCFWHQHGWTWDGTKLVKVAECPTATMPKSNQDFWRRKFEANVQRDMRHEKEWDAAGWNLIVVWECALKNEALRNYTFDFICQKLHEFLAR